MRIGLLSCTSMKQPYPCKASKMYEASPRFKLAYQYAKTSCDAIYILSAKYGLIHEDTFIEPYNETLNEKSDSERKDWSRHVLLELEKKHSLQTDEYLILAGMKYCEFILPHLRKCERPLSGVSLGNWIPTLTAMLKDQKQGARTSDCDRLHEVFNSMRRLTWTDIDQVPFENGIYVMFEKGEHYKNWDRIVRIGTHTSDNRLKARLRNHFLTENKDGSIFRKNIGMAILKSVQDPYLSTWGLDTSKPNIMQEYARLIDREYQAIIEKKVTQYLKENISFACISVDNKANRLRYEEGIISSLSHSQNFQPSEHWLGLNSPKIQIVQSGLWNSLGLDAHALTAVELASIYYYASNLNKSLTPRTKEEALTEISSGSSLINRSRTFHNKASTHDIKEYILSKISDARQQNIDHIDLVSGGIHSELGLSNCMPSVCSAMRQVMGRQDTILRTTPSGNSSTITIRYSTRR